MLSTRSMTTSLLAGCVAFAISLPSAYAQNNDSGKDAKKKTKQMETVVVTGVRGQPRTEADSMSPVDVLTPDNLKSTGASSLAVALRTLLPSLNFPQPSLADGTDGEQPAQLRGLSPDETLVLINGKRLHTTAMVNGNGTLGRGSSPVDLNAIPMSAIDHIEVLRDGAAAQYGSDAIAGVINIILKSGAGQGSVGVSDGSYKGQGKTYKLGANGGIRLGDKGWVNLSAGIIHQDPTNHAGPEIRYPGDPAYGEDVWHYGLPLVKTKQAALNAAYNLTANAQLYAFATFNKRNVTSNGFYRAYSQYDGGPHSSRTAPGAMEQYPNGFLPQEHYRTLDDQEALGVRGVLADWNYDLSFNTGGNNWKFHTSNTWNYSLDPNSPTSFYIGTVLNRDNILNADFHRVFDVAGLAGGVSVAWGLEYRHQKYQIKPGEPASYFGSGGQVYTGYSPQNAGTYTRHNTAEYVDVESDLTDKFTAGLAIRHENYSDFGGTFSSKISARYAFNETVALRATASTGFRAPSLQQEHYSNTVTLFTGSSSIPVNSGIFPVSNPIAVALGAQPLKAEKSHSFSMGLVLTPANGLYVTLDAYQIRIKHRIILSGVLSDSTGVLSAYMTSVGLPQVGGVAFFNNAVDTRTTGADLVATYPINLSGSTLKLTAGMNYNKNKIESIAPNPPQVGLLGLTLPIVDSAEQRRLTVAVPKTKAFVGADWLMGNWGVHAQATRYGSFVSNRYILQTFSAKTLLDLSADYSIDNWKFTLGGSNVTNVYPDKFQPPTATYNIILPYPGTSPFGFNGAYYYGSLTYSWP